jgi:hypothetical protein
MCHGNGTERAAGIVEPGSPLRGLSKEGIRFEPVSLTLTVALFPSRSSPDGCASDGSASG